MSMNISGLDDLVGDINRMANRLNTDGEGAAAGRQILVAAAQPIHEQMKANARATRRSSPAICTVQSMWAR